MSFKVHFVTKRTLTNKVKKETSGDVFLLYCKQEDNPSYFCSPESSASVFPSYLQMAFL